jgi:hypothetical protein
MVFTLLSASVSGVEQKDEKLPHETFWLNIS